MGLTFVNAWGQPYPNSQFLEVEGVIMHYLHELPDDGYPPKGRVALIHGFAASTFSWRKTANALIGEGYEVVRIDLPPFGYSKGPECVNTSPSSQAFRIWKVLDHLSEGPYHKWHLIGHSMGAAIVGAMGAYRIMNTQSVVFVDGAMVDHWQGPPKWMRRTLQSGAVQDIMNGLGKLFIFKPRRIKRLLADAYAQEPDEEAIMGYLKPLKQKGMAANILQMAVCYNEIYTYERSNIQAPCLIIWGDQDTWVPLKDGIKFRDRFGSVSWELIEGAGHCPMETHAPLFEKALFSFLDQTVEE